MADDSVSDWGVKVKIACSACSVGYALDYVKYGAVPCIVMPPITCPSGFINESS